MNREKTYTSVQSDKEKGTFLNGSDIIFAFEDQRACCDTQAGKSLEVVEGERRLRALVTPSLRELGFETKCVCIH